MRVPNRLSLLLAAVFVASMVAVAVIPASTSADPTFNITGRVTARRSSLRANAVVYIKQMPGRQRPGRRVEMDQTNQQFSPRVLPIVAGTTVRFLNNDATEHNVYSPDGTPYDLGNWGQGGFRDHTFNSPGVYTQLCHLHPTMIAYVVVLQNRFFSRTRRSGAFRIANVPPGTYQLEAWQERGQGGPVSVTVTDADVEVEIPLGRRRR